MRDGSDVGSKRFGKQKSKVTLQVSGLSARANGRRQRGRTHETSNANNSNVLGGCSRTILNKRRVDRHSTALYSRSGSANTSWEAEKSTHEHGSGNGGIKPIGDLDHKVRGGPVHVGVSTI